MNNIMEEKIEPEMFLTIEDLEPDDKGNIPRALVAYVCDENG